MKELFSQLKSAGTTNGAATAKSKNGIAEVIYKDGKMVSITIKYNIH